MKQFRNNEIARLHHELALSPWRHRLHQIAGIIRTIALVEPKRDYPYSFIAFQVTGYRPRRLKDDPMITGKVIIEDLIDLADALTESHPLPVAALPSGSLDADQLSSRFKVSPKTISRWIRRGLVGCWYRLADGASRLLFSPRAIQSFVARNRDLVRRGASFTLMNDDERAKIILRARELAADGQSSLHTVTLRIAEETGRAVETIRYTLRRFDFDNPAQALFDRQESANKQELNRVIHEAFLTGDSIRSLAVRFERTETDIRQIIHRARVDQLAATPVSYMPNDEFDAPDAESVIMADPPRGESDFAEEPTLARMPADLPPYVRDLYNTRLLTAAEERHLFRRMNYLLHRAELIRRRLVAGPAAATPADVDEFERALQRASPVKDQLVQSNLRLVVSIARRHCPAGAGDRIFELVSDGNVALLRAVEKFDYARGFRFSTYATWAITRAFARAVPEEAVQAARFRTGLDEILIAADDHRSIPFPSEEPKDQIRTRVAAGLSELDERERLIVERRFGLGGDDGGKTFDEIGREIGISKERVRQIEMRALRKLRQSLGEASAELLAG